MLDSIFATKLDMTQAWSKQGKRYAVTRCQVEDNLIVNKQVLVPNPYYQTENQDEVTIFEIGYGPKKIKNMTQPLRKKLEKSGFSQGVKQLRGLQLVIEKDDEADQPKVGQTIKLDEILSVGDVVKVQGETKGKGFSGVMKRYGFKGGQRTHGQRDRERAPGSIGASADPGRVWPGKKMPGRMGGAKKTVKNLVVLHIDHDKSELWLSGPIPGAYSSTIKITRLGDKKEVALDLKASGLEKNEKKSESEKDNSKKSDKKETKKETKED